MCFHAKYAVGRDGASSIAEPEWLAGELSSSIRYRFRPAVSTKSRSQLDAVWYASSTAARAARRLGKSVRTVTSFVGRLRRMGVPVKPLPAHPGPLVRAVRGLVPSMN